MKRLIIRSVLCLLLPMAGAKGAEFQKNFPAELRNREPAFGYLDAYAIAEAQRIALYGPCGMCVYKEQRGPVWVFGTKIGYGGLPAPDICVIEPEKKLPRFDAKLTLVLQSRRR